MIRALSMLLSSVGLSVVLLSPAHAEPYRTTVGAFGGASGSLPTVSLSGDYGFHHHVALGGTASLRTDLRPALSGELLLFPLDGRWGRLGLAVGPTLSGTSIKEPSLGGLVGLRGSWLAVWGVGIGAGGDVLLSPDGVEEVDWRLGMTVRM